MGSIFVYSLIAAANATLLTAVTIMLFLPSPKRLLLGYLLGGLLVSLTIGFVIVFAVHHSGATSTSRQRQPGARTSPSGCCCSWPHTSFAASAWSDRRERKKKEKEGSRRALPRSSRSSEEAPLGSPFWSEWF